MLTHAKIDIFDHRQYFLYKLAYQDNFRVNMAFFGLECPISIPLSPKPKFDTLILLYNSHLSTRAFYLCKHLYTVFLTTSHILVLLASNMESLDPEMFMKFSLKMAASNLAKTILSVIFLQFSENSYSMIPILNYLLFVFERILKTIS